MSVEHRDRVKGEMAERLQSDLSTKKAAAARAKGASMRDPYEELKREHPGEPVYAIAVAVKCPWDKCAAVYPVRMFATKMMGQQFHLPCSSCREHFLTLRDVVRTFPKNTYPVAEIEKAMREQPGKYTTWMNQLKAAYEALSAAGKEVWKQGVHREHVLHGGSGSKRPVKLRMSAQTMDEAVREMKPTMLSSRRHNPMDETNVSDVAEFLADDDVAGKFGR